MNENELIELLAPIVDASSMAEVVSALAAIAKQNYQKAVCGSNEALDWEVWMLGLGDLGDLID